MKQKKLIKVMFVCLGNICRSPMAEFVFRDMVEKAGLKDSFFIASSATSNEEEGNPVHHGTRNILKKHSISVVGKRAVQLTKKDYIEYDYLIAMEQRNITSMQRIIGEDTKKKVYRLLDFSDHKRDIADPWYTENFEKTYQDICEGCTNLLEFMKEKEDINIE